MVSKADLQSEQKKMNAACFVERAREMASSLEDRENDAVDDLPVARQIAAGKAGVRASLFYSLRYRPPKTVAADVFNNLCAAIERRAMDQIGIAKHEITTARARRLGADDRALREAEDSLARAGELLEKIRK